MLLSTTSFANNSNQQETIQDAEGNTYRTVKIGDQVWMAENLYNLSYNCGIFTLNCVQCFHF